MTAQELQQRNEKAHQLRVLQSESGKYYVESGEGKILHHVIRREGETPELTCTCADFAASAKENPSFQCEHILAVINCLSSGYVENARFLERPKPKLDERFIKTIEGKEFVLYSGLLDLAHQKGLLNMTVETLQLPVKENGHMAICKAVAQSRTGTFSDIGDANPANCNARVGKHILRMASTRAKARALRDLTNIGMTCLEELGDFNEVEGEKNIPQKSKTRKASTKKSSPGISENGSEPTVKNSSKSASDGQAPSVQVSSDNSEMSDAQRRAIHNLSRRRGMSVEDLDAMSAEMYGVNMEFLSFNDAASLIRHLQSAA